MTKKRLTTMKTLIFEGAGWEGADTSKATDVTNCRIRTRIKNNSGRVIYLEMGGSIFDKKSKNTPGYAKGFEVVGRIDHCFYDDSKWDARRNHSAELSKFEHSYYFEYSKENILKFVNENLNCSFDEMEVINDGSVRVHDAEEPLCDCSIGEYEPYKDIEININVLDNIMPVLDCKDRGFAQYAISYNFIKGLPFVNKWMELRTDREKEEFKNYNYYASFRWDKNGIIYDLELSARENFCNFSMGSEYLQTVIDEIKKHNNNLKDV